MEKVTFGPDNSIPGYEVGAKDAPAVIVLQEWWGVTDTIKEQATYLSSKGFRCLIPDLYKGALGVDVEEAKHHMSHLDWALAVAEIGSAAVYLAASGSPAVGATGFCMGGALTLAAAQASEHIKCAAPFYGVPGDAIFDAEKMTKPVQGHFGELDNMEGFSNPAAAKALEEKLALSGGKHAIFMYPGVGHAFMNASPWPFESFQARKEKMGEGFPDFSKDSQELAWGRLVEFLNANLK